MIERDRDADGNSANGLEERLYVQQDGAWNVTAVISAAGSVQERYIYDPFGVATIRAPDWSARGSSSFAWNNFYQGGRFDAVSGVYDFRNRAYQPALGRWVQQDPIGYLDSANLYRAVRNNPVTHADPSGLLDPLGSGVVVVVTPPPSFPPSPLLSSCSLLRLPSAPSGSMEM